LRAACRRVILRDYDDAELLRREPAGILPSGGGDHTRVTAQIADTVELDAQEYSIAGVRGGPLFDPLGHRIKPGAISTACWRGYVCSYTVTAGSLRLAKLVTGLGTKVAGRALGPGH
jgi:hypothetical protein